MVNNAIRICAGIVTYNPDITRLKDNYESISKQVDYVIICDNGSNNINEVKKVVTGSNDIIIELGQNEGIAYALNRLCECAYKNKYCWIITLDQDSVCPQNMVSILSEHCKNRTAIIGPHILYKGNEEYSAKFQKRLEKVDWVITSGSLTNTKVWKKINGFDDFLFIDKVDTEYCVRANRAGYPVIRDNAVVLNHELGKMTCKKLFGKVIYVTNHNEMRIYYQCRNIVYIYRKISYGNCILDLLKIIIKIILYENHKILKLKNAFKGIYNGIKAPL